MIDVRFYHKRGFVLCVANTGDYDFDTACLGLVGSGTSDETAKNSLIFQINQRIKSLTAKMKDEKLFE